MKKLKPFETTIKPITPIHELKRLWKFYNQQLDRYEPGTTLYHSITKRIADITNEIRAYQKHENEYFGTYPSYKIPPQPKQPFFTKEKILYFAGLFSPKQFLP